MSANRTKRETYTSCQCSSDCSAGGPFKYKCKGCKRFLKAMLLQSFRNWGLQIKMAFVVALLLLPYFTLGMKFSVEVGKLKMPRIGVGTWAWGNKFLWGYSQKEDKVLEQVYNCALSNGLTWFDTADSYGTGTLRGRSEELLGAASIKKCILESQARLGKPVDMLQLHWPPIMGWQLDAHMDAFANAIADGHALQLGASNFGPQSLSEFQLKLRARGCQVYSNQVQFSLLNYARLNSGLLETGKELGVQPIAYSPLALGLLTDKYSLARLPQGPRSLLFREYLPGLEPLLGVLRDVAKSRQKTVAQVVLNWTMCKGFLVLVGMRSVQQVDDNLGALGWLLTSAEIECIDKAAEKLPKLFIQNPNQSK